MIIYLHRNTINGKAYIGQTKTILAQRNQYDSNDYKDCGSFWNAIEKYGWDKLSHTILEKCTEILHFIKQLFLKIIKNKGTISVHKANKNYTWMYLTDYLNC